MRADLHIHTTASDGVFSSEAILASAKEAALEAIAITDHDTLGGIDASLTCAKAHNILCIPGVEISAGGDEEIHILAYGVTTMDEKLNELFRAMQQERIRRARRICEKLTSLSMPVDVEKVYETAGGSVGRPHIAREMVRLGYVNDVSAAFDRYLGKGRCAFVSREKLPPTHVIRLIRESGAVPVLAHPIELGMRRTQLLPLLTEWKDNGLMGIEVYHPTQRSDFASWLRVAGDYDLLVTGGSDFHAPNRPNGPLGNTAEKWQDCQTHIARLMGHLRPGTCFIP